jgi:hypothetical protein
VKSAQRKVIVIGLALGLVLAGGTAARASTFDDGGEVSPSKYGEVLAEPANGEAAIDQLGDDVSIVAARNGMSETAFRQKLSTDSGLWVDQSGHLFQVDPIVEGSRPDGDRVDDLPSASGIATVDAAAINVTDINVTDIDVTDIGVPVAARSRELDLHSRRGAAHVVYLDFTGHTIENTAWNWSAGPKLEAPEFDLDGNPGFSDLELKVISDAWQHVAEDFAPFDVDITTKDPGAAVIARTGTRVVVTGSKEIEQATCGFCGGVAYLDAIGKPDFHPAFAFVGGFIATGNGDGYGRSIADIASHEIGHNFGLMHDGFDGDYYSEYYWGQGPWHPIMGSGGRRLSQFSNGDYAGATNVEDDVSMIARTAPFVADDHGNTDATATPIPTNVDTHGLIGHRTDVDTFRWTQACSGPVVVGVRSATVGPNLDIEASIRDASGALLASNNPLSLDLSVANFFDAEVSLALEPGTYTLTVDGVGEGDPQTGYSDYGSLGRYVVQVGSCNAGAQAGNDSAAAAAPMAGSPRRGTGNNRTATGEPGEKNGDGAVNSLWWTFSSPTKGKVTLDTMGSNFDTYLCVYKGSSLGTLTKVGCNNNHGGSSQSLLQFTAQAGVVYRVQVDGIAAATGDIVLNASHV